MIDLYQPNRTFEWIRRAFAPFNRSAVKTVLKNEGMPTFDLFSWSRLAEVKFDTNSTIADSGTARYFQSPGLPAVPDLFARFYLYFDFFGFPQTGTQTYELCLHDSDTTFASGGGNRIDIAQSPANNPFGQNEHMVVRNVICPPRYNLLARHPSPTIGDTYNTKAMFIDLPLGEAMQVCGGGQ